MGRWVGQAKSDIRFCKVVYPIFAFSRECSQKAQQKWVLKFENLGANLWRVYISTGPNAFSTAKLRFKMYTNVVRSFYRVDGQDKKWFPPSKRWLCNFSVKGKQKRGCQVGNYPPMIWNLCYLMPALVTEHWIYAMGVRYVKDLQDGINPVHTVQTSKKSWVKWGT